MIELKGLNVNIGNFHLRDINLTLGMAEYVVLLGPSGVGKTILIETIAGVHRPKSGRILMNGKDITSLPPEQRRVGYVPQDYALFPNMPVADNIAFALSLNTRFKRAVREEARRLATSFGIDHLLPRMPHTLSGGEKQRVALARALAVKPRLLLLDEPLSALDNVSRTSMCMELKGVQKRFEMTMVHVTHDLEEAFTLSDKVAVMMDGTIVQCGSTREVFHRSRNRKIAEFVGVKNIFEGKVVDVIPEDKETLVSIDGVVISAPLFSYGKGDKVLLCTRPEEIMLIKPGRPLRKNVKENAFSGTLTDMIEQSSSTLLLFQMKGKPIQFYVKIPNHILDRWGLAPGKELTVSLKKSSIWLTGLDE